MKKEQIIEEFSKWWDSYESHPPKSSVIGYLVRKFSRQEKEMKAEFKRRLKRIKLDMDVVVCDCGRPYKDSDPADLINELLKQLPPKL